MNHKIAVDNYYANLIDMCINARKESLPKVNMKQKHKPYWCELVVPKRENALLYP